MFVSVLSSEEPRSLSCYFYCMSSGRRGRRVDTGQEQKWGTGLRGGERTGAGEAMSVF